MYLDVVGVWPEEGTTLRLAFQNGEVRRIDIASVVRFTGVFAPLLDADFFRRVRVNSEIGTIVWPNDADLCPDVLYERSSPVADPSVAVTEANIAT